MPRKKAPPASDDAVLRLAQTSLEGMLLAEANKTARSIDICTRAIRAIQNAGLHLSKNDTIRNEARSTLSLAFRKRSSLLHNDCGAGRGEKGDLTKAFSDARAAADMASCTDDAVSAQLQSVKVLIDLGPYGNLADACELLEKSLKLPDEPPKLRFMGALPSVAGECGPVIERARNSLARVRIAYFTQQGEALRVAGKHEEAVEMYSRADVQCWGIASRECETKEFQARALTAKAASLVELGRLAEAVANAKVAVLFDPAATDGHLWLGHALERAGCPRNACLAYMRGAKAAPSNEMKCLDAARLANRTANAFAHEDIIGSAAFKACAVCRQPAERHCALCHEVWYCSEEHQHSHWRRHKDVCATLSDGRKLAKRTSDLDLMMRIARVPAEHPPCVAELRDVATWEAFAARFPVEIPPPRQAAELHQTASFPLTLASALVAFELEAQGSVCVHLINIDHNSRMYLDVCGGIIKLLPLPQMQLLFCGLSSVRSNASPKSNAEVVKWDTMAGRNTVLVRTIWSVWHESERELPPPDLVVGFNTDLHDVAYEWPATLRALVARNVPCVFTAASEQQYERALAALREAKASLAFHGPAPFPSPQAESSTSGDLQFCNSFWVAFCGGHA